MKTSLNWLHQHPHNCLFHCMYFSFSFFILFYVLTLSSSAAPYTHTTINSHNFQTIYLPLHNTNNNTNQAYHTLYKNNSFIANIILHEIVQTHSIPNTSQLTVFILLHYTQKHINFFHITLHHTLKNQRTLVNLYQYILRLHLNSTNIYIIKFITSSPFTGIHTYQSFKRPHDSCRCTFITICHRS